jgi:hypothetical protein
MIFVEPNLHAHSVALSEACAVRNTTRMLRGIKWQSCVY